MDPDRARIELNNRNVVALDAMYVRDPATGDGCTLPSSTDQSHPPTFVWSHSCNRPTLPVWSAPSYVVTGAFRSKCVFECVRCVFIPPFSSFVTNLETRFSLLCR